MSRYTRTQWGARYRAGFGARSGNYPLRENWLHHSVTAHLSPNATFAQECNQMRILENIGQQRFNGGISYNFVIFPSGRAYHGLGASRIGAHTAGRNSIALSVVFAGNYSSTAPTAAALGAAAQLLKDLRAQGVLAQPRFNGGHRDAPGNAGTACPGNALRGRISAINSQAAGSSSGGSSGGSGSNGGSSGSSGGSSGGGSSSGGSGASVTGRHLRITANQRANIRAGASTGSRQVGTVARGHLVRRDSSRDTNSFYGVGGGWYVGKQVATPVTSREGDTLVVGDWPGRNLPVNGNNTFELNRAWRELLARVGHDGDSKILQQQSWLRSRGYSPGTQGIEGPATIGALQEYLRDNGHNPGPVDKSRGPQTRRGEARFLNSQIRHLDSLWPQHYRHRP